MCIHCGGWKPLEEFHRDRKMRDSRSGSCRDCKLAGVRERNRRRVSQSFSAEEVKAFNDMVSVALRGEVPSLRSAPAQALMAKFRKAADKLKSGG